MRPDAGLVLGDRYRLVSRIAVGGMGEVWVAHDDALRRDVAVKVLREEFAGDEGFLERFRTEARNSAQLSHPNIAALYDYGEEGGSGFLVMELVLGEPMSDLLDRQPVLPTRRLLPILAQTARALHAAHVASVVHRDVKPGNILLARSGRVKITDFGISTASNQIPMTASGMVMGTAQYLSPEQAMGRAATPASDIYSLGIVAYEGLVGHRPFTGSTAVDIAIAHVNTPVPPLPSSVDPALAQLVMRMLDKDPEKRPRSAASLARQLDDMVDRTPSEGVPVASGRHSRPVDVIENLEPPAVLPSRPVPHPRTLGSGPVPVVPVEPSGADDDGPGSPATPAPGTRWSPDGEDDVWTPAGPSSAWTPDGTGPTWEREEPGADATSSAAGTTSSQVTDAGTTSGATAARTPSGGRTTPDGGVQPGRVSTSTGRRWRGLTHPLIALVLMLLFALLGAAFADRLWGPSRAADGPASGTVPGSHVLVASASVTGTATSGMIGDGHESGSTTTAKDR